MFNLLPLLILVATGLFLLVYGWMLLRVGTFARIVERRVDAEGIDGEGTITSHRMSTGRRRGVYYFITYDYTVRKSDGTSQSMTSESAVSYSDYDRYMIGDHIPLRYLADAPNVVRLGAGIQETFTGSRMRLNGILILITGLVPIILAVVLFFNQVHNYALPGAAPHGRLLVPMLTSGSSKIQIFRFDLDGSGRSNLTNTDADERNPVWSPDGQQIAFVSQQDGNSQIYVMNADGSNPRNLSARPKSWDTDPAWSSDGKRILFHSTFYNSSAGVDQGEIWIMDADGKNQENLSGDHAHDDSIGSWSPDGKHIVFRASTPTGSSIWTMDSDGTHSTRLTPENGEDNEPVWSPDGQHIAFLRGVGSNQVIWLMDADGSNVHQLVIINSLSPQLEWSPDGQMLAFISAPPGYDEIFIIKADGTDLHEAASTHGSDLSFTWSGDSKEILTEVNTLGKLGVLMLIDVAAKTRTTIVDDAYSSVAPAWMPNLSASP